MERPPPALATLVERLGADKVVSDAEVLAGLSRDHAPWVPSGAPLAAVRARRREDVVETLRWAHLERIAVVPRGAGTGLSGGANALDGSVVLDTSGMDQILEVDTVDRIAVVEPGVLNGDLKRRVAAEGLWYPPDPSSFEISTIGGNVATNAGGLCCVRYGVTRDYVAALEVVLADGEILRTGTRTRKGVAGYDLVGLFTGSEGTLGVITEVAVRLLPVPPPSRTVVAAFSDVVDAGRTVGALVGSELELSLLELMDGPTLRAVDDATSMGFDPGWEAMLLLEVPNTTPQGIVDIVLSGGNPQAVFVAEDEVESDMFLQARRMALPALERLGQCILDDVCVPISRIAAMLSDVQAIAEEHDIRIATFGHAGDGNLHPTLITTQASSDTRVRSAFESIVSAALHHGGTITGEHGVGTLKLHRLHEEIGDVALSVHRALKLALDPLGLLNPGTAVPRT